MTAALADPAQRLSDLGYRHALGYLFARAAPPEINARRATGNQDAEALPALQR